MAKLKEAQKKSFDDRAILRIMGLDHFFVRLFGGKIHLLYECQTVERADKKSACLNLSGYGRLTG
jgi:hypothetical protein